MRLKPATSCGASTTSPSSTVLAATLTAVLWHGQILEEAVAAGAIELTGPRRLLSRLLTLFPLPAPAAA